MPQSPLKSVDADAAIRATQLLDEYRWTHEGEDAIAVRPGGVFLSRNRADRLEQAIAEVIHDAYQRGSLDGFAACFTASRSQPRNTAVPPTEPGQFDEISGPSCGDIPELGLPPGNDEGC